jgi:hypothetical protein
MNSDRNCPPCPLHTRLRRRIASAEGCTGGLMTVAHTRPELGGVATVMARGVCIGRAGVSGKGEQPLGIDPGGRPPATLSRGAPMAVAFADRCCLCSGISPRLWAFGELHTPLNNNSNNSVCETMFPPPGLSKYQPVPG